MRVIESIKFFDNATETGESAVSLSNVYCSQLIVQVTGSATAFELHIKGALDKTSATTPLGCINTKTFDVSHKITANGIYAIAADGMTNISAEIVSITGGNVSVLAKMGD